MEKVHDVEKIKQMLLEGEVKFGDRETGRNWFLYASCPTDSHDSSLIRVEKVDSTSSSIVKATFKCPICSQQFSVQAEDMFLM